ncbi:MAG: short-chain dehydrogenase [Melioribacteraceae bacterium]|nr:MAG: short-chain dehydrogenase [Melioribacteraceae bacterium]
MQEKVVLVTGANRGIGFEVCRQLLKLDHKVILTSRNADKGMDAVSKLENEGLKPDFVKLDMTEDSDVSGALRYVHERYDRLDVLVNNAGIFIDRDREAINIDPEVIKRTLDVNFFGVLKVTQKFIPLMKKNKFGHIINISSNLGALSKMAGNQPAYRISKTALNALTLILAAELKGSNIMVNAMSPGWVRTDMGGYNANRSVEKGAETIVWLASQERGFASGRFFMDKKPIEW